MIDSSENQIWPFGGGAVKLTHAGTGDFECASPRSNKHCRRDERASPASHFLTHYCKAS
jgi:hypothetical protein